MSIPELINDYRQTETELAEDIERIKSMERSAYRLDFVTRRMLTINCRRRQVLHELILTTFVTQAIQVTE